MAKTLRRPTKPMMLAVNASIDGKKANANKLIKEYKLSQAELKTRLEIRDGEKYDFTRKGGRPKGSKNKAGRRGRPQKSSAKAIAGRADDLLAVLDGRTKTVTLLKIAIRVEELIDTKPKAEVKKIEKALVEADSLKEKYEEAMALIGDEIPI